MKPYTATVIDDRGKSLSHGVWTFLPSKGEAMGVNGKGYIITKVGAPGRQGHRVIWVERTGR